MGEQSDRLRGAHQQGTHGTPRLLPGGMSQRPCMKSEEVPEVSRRSHFAQAGTGRED